AILHNGILARRAVRLSDDSAFTKIALDDQPLEKLIARLHRRILTRDPVDAEIQLFASVLRDGYASRLRLDAPPVSRKPLPRGLVSWSNHLDPKATKIKQQLEVAARIGDPPTTKLESDWRERLEDVIWAMVNSPEFVFVP
ncbi:MAG: hypothetical protein N2C14_16440, partial [Planctomycetales bacterium]